MIKLVALENDWHLAFCSRLKGELFQFKPYHIFIAWPWIATTISPDCARMWPAEQNRRIVLANRIASWARRPSTIPMQWTKPWNESRAGHPSRYRTPPKRQAMLKVFIFRRNGEWPAHCRDQILNKTAASLPRLAKHSVQADDLLAIQRVPCVSLDDRLYRPPSLTFAVITGPPPTHRQPASATKSANTPTVIQRSVVAAQVDY